MEIQINNIRSAWEGMGYIAVHGDMEKFRDAGIGLLKNDFRDPYVVLLNPENNIRIGAQVKSLIPDNDLSIEVDEHLLGDLSVSTGDTIEIAPLNPAKAISVRIAASKTDLSGEAFQNGCKTYLSGHALSSGQEKAVYFLSGEGIKIEILEVQPNDLTVFTSSTILQIEEGGRKISRRGLEDIGGLEMEKKIIRERILLPSTNPAFFSTHGIRPPRGILLCGPPGCGKTMMARALSDEIKANFVELNGSEIINPMYGKSEQLIRDKFQEARAKTPAIILIDEIDALGSMRSSMRSETDRRLVSTLLMEMDGLNSLGNVIVVATTNTPNLLDHALRRPGRFDYEIHLGVPDVKGRNDILLKITKHMNLSDDVDLGEFARRTHGFVGADLMLLCRESAFEALTQDCALQNLSVEETESKSVSSITKDHFERALKNVKPSALREFAVEVPTDLKWDDVGGLSGIKDTIVQEIIRVLKDPGAFEAVGINPVRGIMLYGPPGTGKTLIARVIANEAEANFISVKGPEVLSKWFGDSEQRIRTLFTKARESSPCIIFFDEIDAISAARGQSVSDAADRVVNQLLTEMDGFENTKHVCVIAATNRVELVDSALLRPGRFDYQLAVPLPDEIGRKEIFQIHFQSKPIESEIDFNVLVEATTLFSGAHIAEACRRATMTAFRENDFTASGTLVQMRHLLAAVEIVRKTMHDLEHPGIGFNLK